MSCSQIPHQIPYPINSKYLNCCATNTNAGTVRIYSGVTTSTIGFGVSSWENPVSGNGFQSRLNLVALQDKLSDMCFHREMVNMPGERTGQARSMFGQDYVITSTGLLWDNVLQNVIKAFIEVWEMSSF